MTKSPPPTSPQLTEPQRRLLSEHYQLSTRLVFLRLAFVWYSRRVVPSHFFLKDFDEKIARWVLDTSDPIDQPQSLPIAIGDEDDPAAAAPSRAKLPDVIRQGLQVLRAELRSNTAQLQSAGIVSPLTQTAQEFSLSPLETELLQIAFAALLDVRIGGICAAIRGRSDLTHPNLQLALEVAAPSLDERSEALAVLLNNSPLFVHRLLIVGRDASRFSTDRTPWLERDFLLTEPLARFLLEPLTPSPTASSVPASASAPQDLKLVSIRTPAYRLNQMVFPPDFEQEVRDLTAPGNGRVALLLSGKPGSGAPELAEAICESLDSPVCWINPVVAQTTDPSEWFDPLLQHLAEARLRNAIPVVRFDRLPTFDDQEPGTLKAEQTNLRQTLELALSRWPASLILFITRDPPPPLNSQTLDRPILSLNIPDLDRHTRTLFWQHALPSWAKLKPDAPADARLLSLPMNRQQILSVVQQMLVSPKTTAAAASKRRKIDFPLLEQLCQNELNKSMIGFGKRVIPKESWETLILPDETTEQLHELIARARHRDLIFETWGMQRRFARGGGLTALFSGPPGTGKTTAAEIIAVELGTILYRVDLSRLVSKYVGETETNIGQIFAQAKESGALLLFDEADSLFAKRTEVKTSMDRFSNQMVNYLLERLEAYDGVALLTTNLPKSIDDAFQRRIAIHVKFPEPTVDERAAMWRHFFPAETPIDDNIDWYKLGQAFELTGGHIKNAAMRAAVLAAQRNTFIDEDILSEAASREYRAMGRLVRI